MVGPGEGFETSLSSCVRDGAVQHFPHVGQQLATLPESQSDPRHLRGQGNGSAERRERLLAIPQCLRVAGPANGLSELLHWGDLLKQSSAPLNLEHLPGWRYVRRQALAPAQGLGEVRQGGQEASVAGPRGLNCLPTGLHRAPRILERQGAVPALLEHHRALPVRVGQVRDSVGASLVGRRQEVDGAPQMQQGLIHVIHRPRVPGARGQRDPEVRRISGGLDRTVRCRLQRLAEPLDRGDQIRRVTVTLVSFGQRVGQVVHVAGVGQSVNRRGLCSPLGEVDGLVEIL